MENTKSLTFDKAGQDALPDHIKAKMKADKEKSKADNEQREVKITVCPSCKGWVAAAAWEMMDAEDKKEFMVGAAEMDADVISMTKEQFKEKPMCNEQCERRKQS